MCTLRNLARKIWILNTLSGKNNHQLIFSHPKCNFHDNFHYCREQNRKNFPHTLRFIANIFIWWNCDLLIKLFPTSDWDIFKWLWLWKVLLFFLFNHHRLRGIAAERNSWIFKYNSAFNLLFEAVQEQWHGIISDVNCTVIIKEGKIICTSKAMKHCSKFKIYELTFHRLNLQTLFTYTRKKL